MNLAEVRNARPETTGTWILLGRHAVAIAAVLAAYAALAPKVDGFLLTWAGASAVVFTLSGLVAGLALLFFTHKESGRTAITFRNAAWVFAGLLFVDPLVHALNLRALSSPTRAAELGPALELVAQQAAEDPMVAAARTVAARAREDGTIYYATDQKAAVQFDQFVAMLQADPENANKSATELARQAHVSMLTLRGIDEKPSVRKSAFAAECLERANKGKKRQTAKLAEMRRRYPFLGNRDDVAVVRAVHLAFYSDLPAVCVADSLGVELPK